jgi:uncharacterized protein YbjT (DUF2867 family)
VPLQNRSMRVLVTGGTGFVGGWTAKGIADAGHSIRFLVRNPARLATSVAKLGVDVSDYAVGDITDRVSIREALGECDAVVHSAALVATDPRQNSQMLRDLAALHVALMEPGTQMPASDDSPSERELGITYRDPYDTVADTVEALRRTSN